LSRRCSDNHFTRNKLVVDDSLNPCDEIIKLNSLRTKKARVRKSGISRKKPASLNNTNILCHYSVEFIMCDVAGVNDEKFT
jgi:hypothetical protein